MCDKDIITKWILVISLLLFATSAMSQSSSPGLTVQTNPSGAEVEVNGALTLRGISPITFHQGLIGKFNVKIQRPGYEIYKSSVFLNSDKHVRMDVDLTAKTKFKAAVRSLFIPGWGQSYMGKKGKGGLLMVLAAGSVAAFLLADNKFDNKRDDYDDVLAEFNNAGTYERREELYPRLSEARKDAYDAESVRRITIGATAAVWAISFLDALLFFPDNSGSILVDQITLEPDLQNGGGQIVFSCDI